MYTKSEVVNDLEALYRYFVKDEPYFPLQPDWRVVVYVLLTVILSTCLAGMVPALEALKVDLASTMKRLGGRSAGASGRAISLMVGVQVAFSLVNEKREVIATGVISLEGMADGGEHVEVLALQPQGKITLSYKVITPKKTKSKGLA